jgi:integrase
MASISKRILPSGKRQWRVSYADTNGKRKRPSFSSWKEADRFRQEIEEKLRKGTYRADAERMTVKETCEAFLDHCEGRMKRDESMTRKMHTVYKGHVNNHILHGEHGVGGRKLSQFTPAAVVDFRDAVREAGVSVVTTRKVLATLHAALEFAIGRDWVATNAAHAVKVIGARDEGAKKIVPPSKDALKAILEKAPPELRLKIMFAALTGLRASEQWGLKWADLDFDAGFVSVSQRIDSYGNEGPTKSKAGVREVPLSDALVRNLKEHKLASQFKNPVDFVFANARGNHTCHDNLIKRHYKPVLEAAEVTGINWHSLRHFAVSTWIEQGLQPKTVQTYAGHSSLSVTMDRYGHLFPSDEHKSAMDVIAGELLG